MANEMPIYHNDADGTLWGTPSTPLCGSAPLRETALKSGSQASGEVAARISGKRKARILSLLRDRGPLTLWELAEAMLVQVNQISGRISELNADAQIDQIGSRAHPVSHVPCAVWRINDKGREHMRSTRI